MLTEVDNISVAGTHGVEWDAVELPSQFMEFWTWDQQSLNLLSEHIETKDALPEQLLQALLAARFSSLACRLYVRSSLHYLTLLFIK